jgi:membrane associated rhomboid family serine protease
MGAMLANLAQERWWQGARDYINPLTAGPARPYTAAIMFNDIGPATLVFLFANIALGIAGLWVNPQIIERCAFRPYEFARGQRRGTLIASGFAHADVPHLLFNMITFYSFGWLLERVLGTEMFVVLYVLGLALSPLISLVKHRDNPSYATLGASGAVSAVVFATVVYFPTESLMIFLIPVPIPAWLFAIGYLGYSFWAANQNKGRINHDAHLAGALTGLAFVAITEPRAITRALQLLGI